VPQKIKVFIWKLAQNGCPNQQITPPFNLWCNMLICGMEPEHGHHAMVRCTKATALRRSSAIMETPWWIVFQPHRPWLDYCATSLLENLAP
jgi:hypothetical protein